MLNPPVLNFGEFQIRDSLAMLFLQSAYFTLVSGCKDTNKILIYTYSTLKKVSII